jgi:hypothetical protein
MIEHIINSLKGISGTGGLLGKVASEMTDVLLTMEAGDVVSGGKVASAPVAHDLWYLFAHDNFMAKYYGTPDDYRDYYEYLADKMSFLPEGLKPIKTVRDLEKHLLVDKYFNAYEMRERADWSNNGIYWINTIAFELWQFGKGCKYPSDGPSVEADAAGEYVGYLSFPIGQLGTMEIISLFAETWISGYKFTGVDSSSSYWPKAVAVIEDDKKPIAIEAPLIFPPTNEHGCYGRHLIERGYRRPDTVETNQNTLNSEGMTAYAPVANRDVELFSKKMTAYAEEVEPKLWMRYWIHKDDTLPVPGEFIGILCKPIVTPPHVWWFQESSPVLYAGNWVETNYFTSGIITAITEEGDRIDGGIGNIYTVKIQGCEVLVEATDFCSYSIGDRVAIVKIGTSVDSFTWNDQYHFKEEDEGVKKTDFIIVPATFYKIKT